MEHQTAPRVTPGQDHAETLYSKIATTHGRSLALITGSFPLCCIGIDCALRGYNRTTYFNAILQVPNMTLSNNVFSIFAFSSFIITSIPVWWLLKSSNIPACFYLFWLAAPCLTLGINSVIWNGSLVNYVPVWCDITTRILIASTFGLPACCLAIYRRLYLICSSRSAGQTSTIGRRRDTFADLGICLGIPLFGLVLQYITAGHRFDIIEDFGCRAFTYLTPVAFVLVLVPPLILGLISGIYGYLCIRLLIRERREMLKTSKTQGHISDSTDYILYKRLMLMAALEIVLDVPLSIYVIYANAAHGVSPWISWEDTHYNFSRVGLIPASLWRNVPEALVSTEFDRWTYIALSIISFLAFGFTQQAFEHYRILFRSLCRLCRSDKEDKEIPSPYWLNIKVPVSSAAESPISPPYDKSPKNASPSRTVQPHIPVPQPAIFNSKRFRRWDDPPTALDTSIWISQPSPPSYSKSR